MLTTSNCIDNGSSVTVAELTAGTSIEGAVRCLLLSLKETASEALFN
jgi:hypothetical protein